MPQVQDVRFWYGFIQAHAVDIYCPKKGGRHKKSISVEAKIWLTITSKRTFSTINWNAWKGNQAPIQKFERLMHYAKVIYPFLWSERH